MLSAIAPHQSRICIHCRFRAQKLALEARRLRTDSRAPVRYHGASRAREEPIGRSFGKPTRLSGKKIAGDFEAILGSRLNALKNELCQAPVLDLLSKQKQGEEGYSEDEQKERGSGSIGKTWSSFIASLTTPKSQTRAFEESSGPPQEHDTWYDDFRTSFREEGARSLDDRIKHAFYGHVVAPRFSGAEIERQRTLADLRYPGEWYGIARRRPRKIHLHVGPTNSGKTYQALKRLETARKGVYAGPLRLLAHEVYSRMNAKGRRCTLMTGEERRDPTVGEDSTTQDHLYSCTVEMVPTDVGFEVAVIDEIQMLGNMDRGWAWTSALLGVAADEVHLCGEERTVPLIKEICASLGEEVEIHKYERLTPLQMSDAPLNGKLKSLRKGDCIVCFSVMGIHAMRRAVERATGKSVAIVYGSLPPETRAQQARLFNDPDNDYDFLVASDAIGMGLNLAVKRIIFESSSKFDGNVHRYLGVADIKQIGGRAGRYRTAFQAEKETSPLSQLPESATSEKKIKGHQETKRNKNDSVGYVTTLEKFDYPVVAAAMNSTPEPLRSAGIFPLPAVLERFAYYYPPLTPFSYILTRFHEISKIGNRYHLCLLRDRVWIADILESVRGLTVSERAIFCLAPAARGDVELWKSLLTEFARCAAENKECHLPEVKQLPLEVLEQDIAMTKEYLHDLERLHKGIVVYLWLSYRFAGVFCTRGVAFHAKSMVEERIEEVLSGMSFSDDARKRVVARREKKLLQEIQESLRMSRQPQDPASETSTDAINDGLTEEQARQFQQQEQLDQAVERDQVTDDEDSVQFTDPISEETILEGNEPALDSTSTATSHSTEEPSDTISPWGSEDVHIPMSDRQQESAELAIEADTSRDIEEIDEHRSRAAISTTLDRSRASNSDTSLEPDGRGTVSQHSPEAQSSAAQNSDSSIVDEDVGHPDVGKKRHKVSHNKFIQSTVPLKHLAQIEGKATEVEGKFESRP